MIPFVLLTETPYVARDAGLAWRFPGAVKPGKGRYELVGQDVRGEVLWFAAPKGRFDAEALYRGDTQKTKEADAAKDFAHVRKATVFAGMPAIASDQRYLWNGAAVASRCVYCAQGDRAWVVRLWWPRASTIGDDAAAAFLRTVTRSPSR